MQKFIRVDNAPVTGSVIAVEGIKAVGTANATATTVTIDYFDGTTTTVTTDPQEDADVYQAITESIEKVLQLDWKKPVLVITLPKAVTSILNA